MSFMVCIGGFDVMYKKYLTAPVIGFKKSIILREGTTYEKKYYYVLN